MLGKGDLFGNPYIGVFCVANENMALIPFTASDELLGNALKALEVKEVHKISVDGATVLGALTCMNSKGAIVSHFATDAELKIIGKGLKVERLEDRLNAAGNNILANDNGALVHPGYEDDVMDFISEVLGVPVETGTVAGFSTVGSAAVATNKGVICHPHTSDYEKEQLSRLFGVDVAIATANYGTGLLGACMIANKKGALVGEASTPIELGKIEDGLKLY